MLKSLLKAPAVSERYRSEYNAVLRGVRLVQSFGSWQGQVTLKKKKFTCPSCGSQTWVVDLDLDALDSRLFSTQCKDRGLPSGRT
jgi:hypothetical protein